MSFDPTADQPFRVLIVEDNPNLRRHLRHLLEQNGVVCSAAENEDEAMERVSDEFGAIVADIDLSEAGGDARGGIILAERLAAKEMQIPIILISYNAQLSLPVKGSPEYNDRVSGLGVRTLLDRNSDTFREELVNSLLHIDRT